MHEKNANMTEESRRDDSAVTELGSQMQDFHVRSGHTASMNWQTFCRTAHTRPSPERGLYPSLHFPVARTCSASTAFAKVSRSTATIGDF